MFRTFLLPLALAAALPAVAGPLQPHPAVVVAAAAPTIDPSTFIVGHPASPRWKATPSANGEHPAVRIARQPRGIDANTFLVQPPASVAWTTHSAGDLPVVATSAATPLR